jgi:L-fuculose-phosphate aldolase
MKYVKERDELIAMGRLMWEKGLVAGWNGNLSLRVSDAHLLMTATGTCLGRLERKEIVLMTIDGKVLGAGVPTSESHLHFEIYRNLTKVKAVVHTHTPCINAFFLNRGIFRPRTLEARHVLGEVYGVAQSTMNVTDAAPVIKRLGKNTLVALKAHGIVSTGSKLFDCFAKIQVLEEQLWIEALGKLFKA